MLDETDKTGTQAPPAPPRPDKIKDRKGPGPAKLDSQGHSADFFRSVDSAPLGVSVARPRVIQDTALIAFAFVSVILLALPEVLQSA